MKKLLLCIPVLFIFLLTNETVCAQSTDRGNPVVPDTSNLSWQGKVKKRTRDGEWKAVDSRGNVVVIATYTKGVLNGKWESYYTGGKLYARGGYVNGKCTGVWMGFYPNGDSAYVATYADDLPHGPYHDFYQGNKLRYSGTFVHGKKEGEWELLPMSNAKRRYTTEQYVNDTLHGLRRTYYNLKLTEEETYVHGKKHGPKTEYADNGRVVKVSHYADDLLNGPMVKYGSAGDTIEYGSYTNGVRSGYWELRDRGKVITRVWYSTVIPETNAVPATEGIIPTQKISERPDSIYRYGFSGRLRQKEYFRDTTAEVWDRGGVRNVIDYYDDTLLVKRTYNKVGKAETGAITTYYRNGKVSSVVIQDGRTWNGPAVWYHNNGALRARDTLYNSRLTDRLKLYDRKGKLIPPSAKNYALMRDSLLTLTPGLYSSEPVTEVIAGEVTQEQIGEDDMDIVVAPPPIEKERDEVFTFVEEMPSFVGGQTAYQEYLQKNLSYPEAEKKSKAQGIVYVQFEVAKDGSIQNVIVLKGVPGHPAFEQEAVRVIRGMPKWTPGRMNGKPVTVRMTMPVKFVID